MNLSDYELLPGVVVSVNDEACLGRVKGSVPGGESPDNTQIEAMPWIYPMFMTGTYQGFTKLLEGSKIWVMRNKLDPMEMWYWPMMDLNPNTKEIVSAYDNPDVLISRDMGGQNVYIYYTDGQGIMLSVGQTKININEKGEVVLSTGPGQLKISGEDLFINTDSAESHATRCESLTSFLGLIRDALLGIQTSCAASPWTSHVGKGDDLASSLAKIQSALQTETPDWQSENVFIK